MRLLEILEENVSDSLCLWLSVSALREHVMAVPFTSYGRARQPAPYAPRGTITRLKEPVKEDSRCGHGFTATNLNQYLML